MLFQKPKLNIESNMYTKNTANKEDKVKVHQNPTVQREVNQYNNEHAEMQNASYCKRYNSSDKGVHNLPFHNIPSRILEVDFCEDSSFGVVVTVSNLHHDCPWWELN